MVRSNRLQVLPKISRGSPQTSYWQCSFSPEKPRPQSPRCRSETLLSGRSFPRMSGPQQVFEKLPISDGSPNLGSPTVAFADHRLLRPRVGFRGLRELLPGRHKPCRVTHLNRPVHHATGATPIASNNAVSGQRLRLILNADGSPCFYELLKCG